MSTATASTPTVPATSVGPRRSFGFALAGVATTLMLAGASAPSPFYPGLAVSLGIGSLGVTVAFAIYALALLVSLLTVGSLSDHVGRRPIVAAGFLLLAIAALLLWNVDSGARLDLARILQGLASGALIPTMSALIADVAPPSRPQAATVLNTVTPMLGLASGTIVAGALLELVPGAAEDLFAVLAVIYVVVAAVIWLIPETSSRETGWARSLLPRAGVPQKARRLFGISVPIMLAGWATGGLFFSLGPTIVRSELHLPDQFLGALIVGALPIAGAIAALVLRTRRPVIPAVYGSAALAVGTALTLLALVVGSLPLYVVAVLIAGSGFGTAFMGTIGSLVPLAQPHQRAGLFAAIYIVSYLSFGVPAILAGLLSSIVGLHATVLGYGTVVALAAATAAVARARHR